MTALAEWIRYSAFIPAALAAGYALASFNFLQSESSAPFLAAVFSGSFLVYQLDRLLGLKKEDFLSHPARSVWTSNRSVLLACLMVIALMATVGFMIPVARRIMIPALFAGGAGIFYGISFGRSEWRIKDVWWLKPLLIAGTWAVATVWLVAEVANVSGYLVLILLGYRFFYLSTNVLLCDLVEWQGRDDVVSTILAVLGGRVVTFLARTSALGAVAMGALLLREVGSPMLVAADMAGLGGLMFLSLPAWSARISDSVVVDIVSLWPVAVAVASGLWGA